MAKKVKKYYANLQYSRTAKGLVGGVELIKDKLVEVDEAFYNKFKDELVQVTSIKNFSFKAPRVLFEVKEVLVDNKETTKSDPETKKDEETKEALVSLNESLEDLGKKEGTEDETKKEEETKEATVATKEEAPKTTQPKTGRGRGKGKSKTVTK